MINILITFSLLLAVISCGSLPDEVVPGLSLSGSEKDEREDQPPAPTGEDEYIQSIALDSRDDLPECTDKNETQLAYLKKEKLFYVCESGDWVEIDPPVGEAGEKGSKGEDGEDGDDGVEVDNTWEDTITGLIWLVGGTDTWANANAACTGDWSLPTRAQLIAASQHGLGTVITELSSGDDGWTSEAGSAPSSEHWVVQSLASTASSTSVTNTLLRDIFCFKN